MLRFYCFEMFLMILVYYSLGDNKDACFLMVLLGFLRNYARFPPRPLRRPSVTFDPPLVS